MIWKTALWTVIGAALILFAAMFLFPAWVVAQSTTQEKPGVVTPVSSVADFAGRCTAFHIGKGLFVTAGHCVKAFRETIYMRDGSEVTATLKAFGDPKLGTHDFAIFQARGLPDLIQTSELLCRYEIKPGLKVRYEGFPWVGPGLPLGFVVIYGQVFSTVRHFEGAPWKTPAFGVDISASGGASGAPVYLGESFGVLGIMVATARTSASYALVTPIAVICGVLNGE